MKKKIVLFSIIGGIAIILAVLFGAVFCLRNQVVTVVGDRNFSLTNDEIFSIAKLGQGRSIFALDKDGAIDRLEKADAYVKVIQIKTISPITVEFVIRSRFDTYYSNYDEKFYVFDEELKLLKILDDEPENLIKIDNQLLNFENINICEFAGGELNRNVAYEIFTGLYKYARTDDGEFISRNQICEFIKDLSFDTGITEAGNYKRLILTTSFGVKFDIAKPEQNLEEKINICLSSLNSLTSEQKHAGRIKITYLSNGNEHVGYQTN